MFSLFYVTLSTWSLMVPSTFVTSRMQTSQVNKMLLWYCTVQSISPQTAFQFILCDACFIKPKLAPTALNEHYLSCLLLVPALMRGSNFS